MMIASNRFSVTYAEMILVTTRPDALTDKAKPKKHPKGHALPKEQKLRESPTLATLKGAAVRLLVTDPVKKHGPGTDAAPALVTP
jgi:hypothetical protein